MNGGKLPEWNENFNFSIISIEDSKKVFKFSVLDEDLMSSELVGCDNIYFPALYNNGVCLQKAYFNIFFKGLYSGRIEMATSFEGISDILK